MNGVIFGAGPVVDYEAVRELLPKAPFYLIAADGGLRHARALGLVPDAFIGDMDSLREEDLPEGAILYPSQKDDTDMMLAVKKAMALGVRKVLLLGGLGGRLDHICAIIFWSMEFPALWPTKITWLRCSTAAALCFRRITAIFRSLPTPASVKA